MLVEDLPTQTSGKVSAGKSSRILIDPSGAEAENFAKFGKLDAVIYTHEHSDHFDPELAQKFADAGVAIYANASTAKQTKSAPNIIADGQEFSVGSFKIKAMELPHCLMVDGSAGPQNTGYLINSKLFHPGDGVELAGLSAEVLALPIAGPDVSLKDAYSFAKQASAKTIVPIHYDYTGLNPEVLARWTANYTFKPDIKILELGQSIELA